MNLRLRRMQSEYARLQYVFAGHERICIVEAIGRPPEKYVVEYHLKGLVEEKGGEIVERNIHRAEISLGPDYPREMPRCVMLTPVFHPNIDHIAICTQDIGAAGQTLDQTIVFIGQMISFQTFNLQSPRNGDAAKWTAENLERLPLEHIDLVPSTLLREGIDAEIALAASATLARPGQNGGGGDQPSLCANCGGAPASACVNGHLACADCVVTCGNCSAAMCVLCLPARCCTCEAVCCPDCIVNCVSCQRSTCLSHVDKCATCGRLNCKACGAHCQHRATVPTQGAIHV